MMKLSDLLNAFLLSETAYLVPIKTDNATFPKSLRFKHTTAEVLLHHAISKNLSDIFDKKVVKINPDVDYKDTLLTLNNANKIISYDSDMVNGFKVNMEREDGTKVTRNASLILEIILEADCLYTTSD